MAGCGDFDWNTQEASRSLLIQGQLDLYGEPFKGLSLVTQVPVLGTSARPAH